MEKKPLVRCLRGIPGSGKSHYVQYPNGPAPQAKVFSADDFWYTVGRPAYPSPGGTGTIQPPPDGKYNFDPKRIGEAHAWCYREYLDFLADHSYGNSGGIVCNEGLLVIDNTNLRASEIAPYALAAPAYGLDFEVVTIVCDPAIAAARNAHEVPPSVVWQMHQTLLAETLPPYWKHHVEFAKEG